MTHTPQPPPPDEEFVLTSKPQREDALADARRRLVELHEEEAKLVAAYPELAQGALRLTSKKAEQ